MATVVNTRDVLLLAASPRILTISLPTNITVPNTQVSGLGSLSTQNTVSSSDFAVGIEPVGLVNSLPNPVGYTGVKVVFLTTTGKLYRYVSGAWTVAVPAVDVTGQLTDSQLADISAAKLTGQITSTQITDGAISTPKLAAGSVSTAKLAAGSVTTSILAANAVTATEIAAGAITTSKLAANAVTANELAANSVIAGKISAGAVSTTALAANAVTASKIAAGTITATEISSSYVYAGTLNAGQINAGTLSANYISGGILSGISMQGIYFAGYELVVSTTGFAPLLNISGTSSVFGNGGSFTVNSTSATFTPTITANGGVSASTSSSTTITATSSNSSYGAGIFSNSALGKAIYLGGSYAAYSGSGQGKIYAVDGFTPFTGSHEAFLPKEVEYEIGDIVKGVQTLYKLDISNTISEVALTTNANNKAVLGVIAEVANLENNLDIPEETWYNYTDLYTLLTINGVGEGQVNVCGENGNIEIGDLITSSNITGKGMKQSDDIVRSCTVAKARENVTFDSPTQVKQIACIYMCG